MKKSPLLIILLLYTAAYAACPSGTCYTGPTTQGAADCSSDANRCLNATALATAVAGDTINLADGTYTGVNSMISVQSSGTSGNLITIQATNTGSVLINGQGARQAVNTNGNDYILIQGINACCSNSGNSVVYTSSSNSDHITFKNMIAWDGNVSGNNHVWQFNNDSNLLVEDCAGFGTGRKIFEVFNTSGPVTLRRLFGKWMGSDNTSPKETFHYQYNSGNVIAENTIGLYDRSETTSNTQHEGIHRIARNDNNINPQNIRIYGSIGIVQAGDTFDPGQVISWAEGSPAVNDVQFKDTVVFIDSSHSSVKPLNTGTINETDWVFQDATLIGGAASTIDADVTTSNLDVDATIGDVSSIFTSATGAQVCNRYVDGSLTGDPLWPWPMNQRIIDAMTTAGYTPVDVTATIENIFGVIPNECRSDITAPRRVIFFQ